MSSTQTESYEFTVGAAPALEVRDFAGNVTYTAGAGGQVSIRATKRATGLASGAGDAGFERIRVTAEQRGDTITLRAEHKAGLLPGRSPSVDFEITGPTDARLDLHLNAGNAEVTGLRGPVRAKVNAGNLDLRGVTLAGDTTLSCNAGNLTLEGALAAGVAVDASVNAGNARVRLPRATAVHVDARTHVGKISVAGFALQVTRGIVQQSASGVLGAAPQGTLTVRVDVGHITLEATE